MEFETPSPQTRSGHDFSTNPLHGSFPITYKAGTLEAASVKMFFDGKIDRDYLEQGFQMYNPETKSRDYLPSFTAYVLGLYFGSFSNGKERTDIRYSSNLVENTVTDVMQSSYFIDGERHTLAIGNYRADIAPAIEAIGRGSSYTKVLVVYVAELQQIRAIHLNATSEAGFIKAMATAWGQEEWKTKMYGLSELENEIWAFAFRGQFSPVVFSPKEAKRTPATVPADRNAAKMYFQPVIMGGVITPKHGEIFASVAAMRNEFSEYIASEQIYLKSILAKKKGDAGAEYQEAEALHYGEPEPIRTDIRAANDNSGFDKPFRGATPAERTTGTPLDDLDSLPL